MGIEEFVLTRAERIGEKRGIEKGIEKGIEVQKLSFVQALINHTDFDDSKIASLTGVDVSIVQQIRK